MRHRVEHETNKAKIETKRGSEKYCSSVSTKEKLNDPSPRGQVYVEAHQNEVQGRELRGHGNFEWNTDLIETKLEKYTRQVVQDLYSGEAQLKFRGGHEEQHCISLDETLTTQPFARKFGLRILDGTSDDD